MSAVADASAGAPPYYRVRFQDGYIFRLQAADLNELKQKAAAHFWGAEKPNPSIVTLTLRKNRRHKHLVHYDAVAPGYPVMPEHVPGPNDI